MYNAFKKDFLHRVSSYVIGFRFGFYLSGKDYWLNRFTDSVCRRTDFVIRNSGRRRHYTYPFESRSYSVVARKFLSPIFFVQLMLCIAFLLERRLIVSDF